METEARVNAMEIEIDRELSSIIARRQPTARDLRLLIAISKTTANLERVGDEASKIARMVKSHHRERLGRARCRSSELRIAADLASGLLRKALDAFARLDTAAALSILKEDDLIDKEFDGFVRKLITYMMEDPRTISASLDLLFLAKAIERIGDHAKNIAEFIIYIVKGADVRHTSMEQRSSRERRWTLNGRRVLIVEDEPSIAELIAVNLRHNGFRGRAGAETARRRSARSTPCCPTRSCSTGCCPAQSGLALARQWRARRAHQGDADPHAHRARRRARQGGGPRRRRRRLHHQAVLDRRSCWRASAPCCAAARRSRPASSVAIGELALDAATHRVTWQGSAAEGRARPSSSCCTT